MTTTYDRYIQNTEAQMRKGILELCMLIVLADGKERYASDLLDTLKKKQLIVVEGTLYPLLNRLRSEGLLEHTWQESQSGPPRKYYKLTEKGRHALTTLKTSWDTLAGTVSSLH